MGQVLVRTLAALGSAPFGSVLRVDEDDPRLTGDQPLLEPITDATREQLDTLARDHGIEPSELRNKAAVVEALEDEAEKVSKGEEPSETDAAASEAASAGGSPARTGTGGEGRGGRRGTGVSAATPPVGGSE